MIEHIVALLMFIGPDIKEHRIQESRYNKVNIDHLKEQFDAFQKKINGH